MLQPTPAWPTSHPALMHTHGCCGTAQPDLPQDLAHMYAYRFHFLVQHGLPLALALVLTRESCSLANGCPPSKFPNQAFSLTWDLALPGGAAIQPRYSKSYKRQMIIESRKKIVKSLTLVSTLKKRISLYYNSCF